MVRQWVGAVDYEIEMPGKRDETKVYHVNILKKWKERHQEGCMGEDLGPSGGEMDGESQEALRKDLIPKQQGDLTVLKKQGKTNLIHHQIKVKGNKVVRLPPPGGHITWRRL